MASVEQVKELLAELYEICEKHEERDGGPSLKEEPLPAGFTSSVFFQGVFHFGDVSDAMAAKQRRQEICDQLIQFGAGHEEILIPAIRHAPFYRMRANLAAVLGRIKSKNAFDALIEQSRIENNENVLRNCLKSITTFGTIDARDAIIAVKERLPGTVIAQMCDELLVILGTDPSLADKGWVRHHSNSPARNYASLPSETNTVYHSARPVESHFADREQINTPHQWSEPDSPPVDQRSSKPTHSSFYMNAESTRSGFNSKWLMVPLIVVAGIFIVAQVIPTRGQAPSVEGESIGAPRDPIPPQYVTMHVRFVQVEQSKENVTWKCLSIDGYPLMVILDPSITPPQLIPGQPLKLTAIAINTSVVSVRSLKDITILGNLADTRTYVGDFVVRNGDGSGRLYDGQTFKFHAPGFSDGTYNYLEIITDEKGEALATDLDVLENPRELLLN